MVTHIRGRVVTADRDIPDGVVSTDRDRIIAVESLDMWWHANPGVPEPDFAGLLLPGLVDIHNHGGAGHSLATADVAAATAAAQHHHRHGSTTVLAGLVTAPPGTLVNQVHALRELAESHIIEGIYCEGPFLAQSRCGAQDPRFLLLPDPLLTEQLIDAADGTLRVMAIAPELPEFGVVAKILINAGVRVAVGHTDADYPAAAAALAPMGPATLVTHLANGMPPLHHRAPGPVAAALVSATTVELITDGVHIDAGFAALTFAAAPDRVALITDAMAATGMPDGTYLLGPQEVTVTNGIAHTANGALAGGTSHLIENLARVVHQSKVPLQAAVRAATRTPAESVGLTDVGDLRPGLRADVVVVDDDLTVRQVLRRGTWLR